MIDLKNFHQNAPFIAENLRQRGYELPVEEIVQLLLEIKNTRLKIEKINALTNNNLHTAIDKEELKGAKMELHDLEQALKKITDMIPNLLHPTTPVGKGALDNVVVFQVGDNTDQPVPRANAADLGDKVGIDTELGAQMACARFTVLKGQAARLHRTLINAALDFYATKGYEEYYVPNMVNEKNIHATAQYPKFKEELFTTQNDLFLIPTGEVPLTNVVAGKILKAQEANLKMMTHTPCFRKEAGAHGRDTRGIIRQHQFEKVELVRTCLPEDGLDNFNEMAQDIEEFIKKLGLRWRMIELCAGDIGFAGHKAYDFELWFAHDKVWREIATLTWCTDFQARRMNARFRQAKEKPQYLHTLNGTGLAAGRVLAALVENNFDGQQIALPPFLK